MNGIYAAFALTLNIAKVNHTISEVLGAGLKPNAAGPGGASVSQLCDFLPG